MKCSEYIVNYNKLFLYFGHIVVFIIDLPLHLDSVWPNDTTDT